MNCLKQGYSVSVHQGIEVDVESCVFSEICMTEDVRKPSKCNFNLVQNQSLGGAAINLKMLILTVFKGH